MALQNFINSISHKYTREILEKVNFFEASNYFPHKPKFLWVPAHSGLLGNEEADNPYWLLPPQDLYIGITRQMWEKADNHWKDRAKPCYPEPTGIKYFESFYSQKRKPWFTGYNIPRLVTSWVCRARSNHNNLRESLFKINIVENPTCSCGVMEENLNHILWQCPLLERHRPELINGLKQQGWQPPSCIETFLAEPHLKEVKIVTRFLQHCDISI